MTVIATNLLALSSQSNLKRADSSVATAMERLASGLRINSAKDDAAGQAIGNRLTSQITGRAMAQRNANDGVSMAQTAHGALDQINAKLHRIRELTVQGLNGTLLLRDSDAIQAEINMNLQEIDRLAASVDYNGIPLLNGKAGEVNLQVGANDRETLGLDFRPPGFSVEALGLEDFTVRGIEGEVEHLDTVRGRAREIDLYDNTTAVTFNLGGQTFNYSGLTGEVHTFMRQPASDGSYGHYVSDLSGSMPVFYRVSQYPGAHDTASDNSAVQITGQRIFNNVSTLASQTVSGVSFTDSDGNPLTEGTQRLIHHDGQYLIENNQAGVISYHEAQLTMAVDSGGVAAQMGSALDATGEYAVVANSFDFQGNSYSPLNDYVVTEFVIGNDPLPVTGELVSHGTDLYVRLPDGAGGDIYWPLTEVQTGIVDGDEVIRLVASDTEGFTSLDLTGTAAVSSLPSMNINADDITAVPALGDSFDGTDFRLVRRTSASGHSPGWMIEEKVSDTVYRYHTANIEFSLDSNGDVLGITAAATGEAPSRFDLSDDNRVNLVSGTSTVLIDPNNVTVNYTDANGNTFDDVLRVGSDGNYYFDLPNSTSNYGNYKLASLVSLDGEEVLIKTINGTGEVIVYHTTNVDNGINSYLVVDTDANGPDDDGKSHTVIDIREAGQELRIKMPPNPLAALDRAISYVDSKRSHLGAMENRLASVIENHAHTNINLSAARSRIEDADYAVEVSNLTKAQILQQAGTSMLAQANQLPQNVLELLG